MEQIVSQSTVFAQVCRAVEDRPYDTGMHDILRHSLQELEFGNAWAWICYMAVLPRLMGVDHPPMGCERKVLVKDGRAYVLRHKAVYTVRVNKPDGVYALNAHGSFSPLAPEADEQEHMGRMVSEARDAISAVIRHGVSIDVRAIRFRRSEDGLALYELPNGGRVMAVHVEAVRPRKIIGSAVRSELPVAVCPVLVMGRHGTVLASVSGA